MSYSNYLNNTSYSLNGFQVTPMRESDIYLIKDWRNAQLDVLRQTKLISNEDQSNYYQSVVKSSFEKEQPSIMLFSFLHLGECIGYGGLTNIHWQDKRVELSFLVNPVHTRDPEIYERDFKHFIELMKEITFKELGFNRIFTETYDIREKHIRILESCGFILEGRMRSHVCINGIFVDSLIHGILNKDYEF
ncbi:GNAT family N-acetyltransferase [Fluviicola taffensis]|uniref:Putative ribosomal-protein-serine acetyltransferase n=1 Tax=Fluviicola taffensis (strain DSM 16823 / NCIMB 13979 / RW262) TaxID=755732 RepID=F2IC02_FLUTR|nr:GNAT family N-acetyltransferase [Fluviicola taffensis]AEA42230.1 putative ribosomal-protein-serine acetyltransferase [Fluviicola taffensis DSM 16823]